MTRPILAILLLSLAVAGSARCDEPKKSLTITLDGKPFEPQVISLNGTPSLPSPGDLVRVDRAWIVVDDTLKWELFSTQREEGLLYRNLPTGREVISVTVTFTYKGDKKQVINPLAKMTKEEKSRLRGVYLNEWDDNIAKSLSGIDFTKTALTVSDDVRDKNDALAALPPSLHYLFVEEHSNHGIRNYTRLGDLKALRVLHVRSMTAPVPAAQLGKLKELRYLEIDDLESKGIDALGGLTELRTLRLPYCDELREISFVKDLAELVELDVRRTKVADLRPLEGLKKLTKVRATRSPIKDLPKSLPALKHLEVLSTDLTDTQVSSFRKEHPQCEVRHRWEESMREAASGADRVRVRTGGTCHRDVPKEKTLAEIKDAAAIRELLQTVRIDEKRSVNHCMCCGEPSVEFYKGDQLLLTLGVHHGVAVRWVEGWPADGALAGDSAEKIANWLADRGVKGPQEDYERNGKQKAAAMRRSDLVDAAIPEAVHAKLKTVKSRDEAIAAFEDNLDAKARVAVYFTMIGVGEGNWNHSSGPDEFVLKVLMPRVKPEDIVSALKDTKDTATLAGAGRWLFFEKGWDKLPKEGRDVTLKPIAEHALAHPRQLNRRRTMAALKAVGSPGAQELLRRVFKLEFKVRKLDKADETEPPGMVMFSPGDGDLERGSDAAQAAKWLAELGDQSIREELDKRRSTATGDDKALFEAAWKKLTGK